MKKTHFKRKPVKVTSLDSRFQDVLAEAHKTFSTYTRLKNADKKGNVKCFTCPSTMHYTFMHLGHYINRDYLRTAFLEENKVQCPVCNIAKDGNLDVYAQKLKDMYGNDVIDRLNFLKVHGKLLDKVDLLEKISHWKKEIKKMKEAIDILEIYS